MDENVRDKSVSRDVCISKLVNEFMYELVYQ